MEQTSLTGGQGPCPARSGPQGRRVGSEEGCSHLRESSRASWRAARARLQLPAPSSRWALGPAGPGDLVACAGAGYASHAEIVAVPRNLCARVPDGVAPGTRAYATVAAIALHGVRIAEVGARRWSRWSGSGSSASSRSSCWRRAAWSSASTPTAAPRSRARRARSRRPSPASSSPRSARLTDGRGADGVLDHAPRRRAPRRWRPRPPSRASARWCASSATSRSNRRARRCSTRSCGWWSRAPTARAATTRATRSGGVDYPAGYVRWTEGRNLEEVLRLMADGQLRPARADDPHFRPRPGAQAYALLGAASRRSASCCATRPRGRRPAASLRWTPARRRAAKCAAWSAIGRGSA